MKYTSTANTSQGALTVTADIDYDVPKAGDTLNIYGNEITLTEDMRMRVKVTWNDERKIYEAQPMRTTEGTDRIVFYADGVTWREGEYYRKGGAGR